MLESDGQGVKTGGSSLILSQLRSRGCSQGQNLCHGEQSMFVSLYFAFPLTCVGLRSLYDYNGFLLRLMAKKAFLPAPYQHSFAGKKPTAANGAGRQGRTRKPQGFSCHLT